MDAVKKLFGILMLGMAVWMLSRIVATPVIIKVWGLLLLGVALFFSLKLPRLIGRQRFNRSLGFLVGCSGMVLMFGLTPPMLFDKMMNNQHIETNAHTFILVRDVSELNKQLLIAKASHRPAILDFYADWCESCIVMDRNVFSVPEVKQALSRYVVLRADLSANTADDEMLLKQFAVTAPPTVLLFDPNGDESNSHRIIGEVDAKEFLGRLNLFTAASCKKNIAC